MIELIVTSIAISLGVKILGKNLTDKEIKDNIKSGIKTSLITIPLVVILSAEVIVLFYLIITKVIL